MSEDLDELLELQRGILSYDQAYDVGLSRQALSRRVTSGRWQRVHPRVYATSTGPLDLEQRIWAGFLYGGNGAVIGMRSAWWLADREIPEPKLVHVVLPNDRIVARQPGLVLSRTRRFRDDDIQPFEVPRRHRIERAVLDCAAHAIREDDAVALLTSSIQRRNTTVAGLREALDKDQNLPRHALLVDVLEMSAEGAESLIEVAHHRITSSHGLPAPQRQRRVGNAVVDGYYECPDGSVLIAEFDGKLAHLGGQNWIRDTRRDNQHTVELRATLRFPGSVLLTQPHEVAATIAAALTARGWTGTMRCPADCPGRGHSAAA